MTVVLVSATLLIAIVSFDNSTRRIASVDESAAGTYSMNRLESCFCLKCCDQLYPTAAYSLAVLGLSDKSPLITRLRITVRTSMACPSSKSNVTTHTQCIQC